MTNPIGKLFGPFVIDILTIVSENPGIKRTDLYNMLGKSTNTPRVLTTELIADGFIEETIGKRYNVKTLELTEEGERVLSLIKAMIDGKSIEPTNYGAPAAVRDAVKGKNA
ncbi:MAG: hypothetical protein FWD81_02505 [Methanomassiliicoccaceae archaeon]|nr:hypothetical protein [Methanomassiliicoccaceae archaeon]